METVRTIWQEAMRELSISSIEQANEYLKQYVPEHNQKFTCKPALPQDLYRSFIRYNLETGQAVGDNERFFNLLSKKTIKKVHQLLVKLEQHGFHFILSNSQSCFPCTIIITSCALIVARRIYKHGLPQEGS